MSGRRFSCAGARVRQAGFTIVEMMVALAIGLVVVLGLAVAFVNMKSSFVTQDKLTELQDNERVAMTMLTSTLQEAGYFPAFYPDPLGKDRAAALPANADPTYGAMAAGQAVLGTAAASGVPERLSTRYASSGSDTLMNCVGGTLAAGYVRNVFFVDSSTSTLACVYSVNGGAWVQDGARPFALVGNVKSMSVQYGVDTDGDGQPDRYLGPAAVTATQWANVHSARVTLEFVNPTGDKQISRTQTINLMNNQ